MESEQESSSMKRREIGGRLGRRTCKFEGGGGVALWEDGRLKGTS